MKTMSTFTTNNNNTTTTTTTSSGFEDKKITCNGKDCKKRDFIFPASEAEFFALRGFQDPKKCPVCRGGKAKPALPAADKLKPDPESSISTRGAVPSSSSSSSSLSLELPEVKRKPVDKNQVFPEVASFDEMGLKDDLLKGIYAYGYELPTEIQRKAILPLIAERDVIAQAQAGTGKTAVFAISALQRIDETIPVCQALVISPVRELAEQSNNVIDMLGSSMGVKSRCFTGGDQSQTERHNMMTIRAGVHIAVGTPGRLAALVEKNILSLKDVKIFIIDEADELLKDGHEDNLRYLVQSLPEDAQIAMFSATLPRDVLVTAETFMSDPLRILLPFKNVIPLGLKQFLVDMDHEDQKLGCVQDLLRQISFNQAILFVNTKETAKWLHSEMSKEAHACELFYGDMAMEDRRKACLRFKRGDARILIATDALSRGFDVQQVSLVMNVDIPNCSYLEGKTGGRESYTHRIGRSGRFGRTGTAISLVASRRDYGWLQDIATFYECDIRPVPADLRTI